MARLRFVVPPEWAGRRLDSFLRTVHGLSGTTLKAARRRPGGLTLDGAHLRTVDPVCAGGVVVVDTGEESRIYRPCPLTIPVVYEDGQLIVFDKPPGLASHPSRGHPCDTLANVFAARETTAGLTYRPMGRLDLDTSGLLAVAKHAHAAFALPPRVQKQYLALLTGCPAQDEGMVDGPIGQLADEARRRVLPDGRPAVTRWRILARTPHSALALVEPLTGRTHQIRVHMAHLGHPLLGDALYGGDCTTLSRQALHCWRMDISGYSDGAPLRLSAPFPPDLAAAFGLPLDAALAPAAALPLGQIGGNPAAHRKDFSE